MDQIYAMAEDFAIRYLEAMENATPEERAAAVDRFGAAPLPDILALNEDGREASITITGPLSPEGPGPLARFFGFGGTAYKDIVDSAELISDDPGIETVRLLMNTPGGYTTGMDSARQALERLADAGKTVIAENHGLIASAGYYLATAANRIEATGPTASTGSIGVVITAIDPSKAMERSGLRRVQIVSRNAPNKRPDLSTEEGVGVLQAEADAIERVFIAKVAEGRGTTTADVIANYGKGGMLIAQDPDPNQPDALKVGMIDAVVGAGLAQGDGGTASAGPTPFRDFPMADRPWDSAAAIGRVRRFLGADDAPNERYRQAFFWYDSENSANFGAYKLPFVDVVGGRLVAIWNGVSAANGAMSGARGNRVDLPEADRSRVQAHIDRYREKWRRMQEGSGASAIGGGCGGAPETTAAEGGGHETRIRSMDLNTLKMEHPALFTEAVAIGVAQERERVQAHATLGEASGDMALAMQCINEGTELTAAVNAKYMAAGMNRRSQEDRGAEGESALDTGGAEGSAHEDAVAKASAELMGVEIDG